jgi:hypothetical protein
MSSVALRGGMGVSTTATGTNVSAGSPSVPAPSRDRVAASQCLNYGLRAGSEHAEACRSGRSFRIAEEFSLATTANSARLAVNTVSGTLLLTGAPVNTIGEGVALGDVNGDGMVDVMIGVIAEDVQNPTLSLPDESFVDASVGNSMVGQSCR